MSYQSPSRFKLFALAISASFPALGHVALGATIPTTYSDNYTTYTSGTLPSNMTMGVNSNTATLVYASAANNYSGNLTVNGNSTTGGLYNTGVGQSAGSSFNESVSYTIASFASGGGDYLGLSAGGSSTYVTNTTSQSLLYCDFIITSTTATAVTVRFNNSGNGSLATTSFTATPGENLIIGNTYVEMLTGSFASSSSVALSLSLYDSSDGVTYASGATTVSTNVLASNYGGYFGIRDYLPDAASIDYQNYSLTATPEPASLSLLAAAPVVALRRRRRRSTRLA